jgi:5'(3')-deoxyribonucleotidase
VLLWPYEQGYSGAEVFKESLDISKMYEPGFFLSLRPVSGALAAIRALEGMGYDIHILTQPVYNSPHSYSEKAQWLGMWFPELVTKVIMAHDKGMIIGDYLIDNDSEKWREKFQATGGKFVHFQYDGTSTGNRAMWENILEFFRKELESTEI